MRGLENDIESQLFQKVPLLFYRNLGGQKTTLIFEYSQIIHKLVGFRGEGIKRAPASFQKQTLILRIHFFTSLAESAAR